MKAQMKPAITAIALIGLAWGVEMLSATGAVAHSYLLVHNVFKNQIEFLVRAATA